MRRESKIESNSIPRHIIYRAGTAYNDQEQIIGCNQ
jgi:hypothetical protein